MKLSTRKLQDAKGKSFLKTSHTHTERTINEETGEVIHEEIQNIKYLANSNEEFFIIYSSLISIVERGMTLAETSLYAHLLQNYNIGADIAVTKQLRVNIGNKLSLNERTILNTLAMLCNKEKPLLYSVTKGIYKINPRHAYRGSTTSRNRDLKIILQVECPHC